MLSMTVPIVTLMLLTSMWFKLSAGMSPSINTSYTAFPPGSLAGGRFNGFDECHLSSEKSPALFENFTVQITDICHNGDKAGVVFMHLEFHPILGGTTAIIITWLITRVAEYQVEEGTKHMIFPCQSLIRPGFYRPTLSTANITNGVTGQWSHIVEDRGKLAGILLGNDSSIFPNCKNTYVIGWHLPACNISGVMDFRLRVLASLPPEMADRTHSGEEIVLDPFDYVEEFPITTSGVYADSIDIPCLKFDILYVRYCFELVSISRRDRHFHLWDQRCVNTEPIKHQPSVASKQCSEWSEWTDCNKEQNYTKAVDYSGWDERRRACRKRWKYCDQVEEEGILETEPCNTTLRQETVLQKETKLSEHRVHVPGHTPKAVPSKCDCGCTVVLKAHTISSFFAGSSVNCVSNVLSWRVTANASEPYEVALSEIRLTLLNTIRYADEAFHLRIDDELALQWKIGTREERCELLAILPPGGEISIEFARSARYSSESGVYVNLEYRALEKVKTSISTSHVIFVYLTQLVSHIYSCKDEQKMFNQSPSLLQTDREVDNEEPIVCVVLVATFSALIMLSLIVTVVAVVPMMLGWWSSRLVFERHIKLVKKGELKYKEEIDMDLPASSTIVSSPTQCSRDSASYFDTLRHTASKPTSVSMMPPLPIKAQQRSVGFQFNLQPNTRASHHGRIFDRRINGGRRENRDTSNTSLTSENTLNGGDELEYDYSFLRPALMQP